MNRTVLGGVAGGLAMFIWGVVSHMVLPIGETGISTLENEDAIIGVMKENVQESGLYLFPGYDMSRTMTDEEADAWSEKYKAGPIGLLVYRMEGTNPLSPSLLIAEFASNIIAALLVAYILTSVGGSSSRRAILVAVIGLVGWFSLSVSYWNWYSFPFPFILSEGIDQSIGWFLSGLVMVQIVKPATFSDGYE
jgi:hypothetical protein